MGSHTFSCSHDHILLACFCPHILEMEVGCVDKIKTTLKSFIKLISLESALRFIHSIIFQIMNSLELFTCLNSFAFKQVNNFIIFLTKSTYNLRYET